MSHSIQVILGRQQAIESLAERWVEAKAYPLPQGFAVIPLTPRLSDDIQELLRKSGRVEPFACFTEAHRELLEHESRRLNAALAYLETDYFGGTGSQCAVLFENGQQTLYPLKTETKWNTELHQYVHQPEGERAINAVLKAMGVWNSKAMDKFDALELGKYRTNEAFFR